jgi:uncharacterized protein YjiS (DUF1127 family)
MNEALPIGSSNARDEGSLPMLRRMRGDARVRPGKTAAPFAASFSWLSATLRALLARYREYRDARETMRALCALDDRTLHDLGYHRSEIESVALEVSVSRLR